MERTVSSFETHSFNARNSTDARFRHIAHLPAASAQQVNPVQASSATFMASAATTLRQARLGNINQKLLKHRNTRSFKFRYNGIKAENSGSK